MGDRWKYNPFRIRSSPILFVFCFVSGNLDSSSSLSEQGLTLLRFRDRVVKDPYGALVNWNPRNDPCSWNGIECSSSGLVVTLNLKDLCLEGTLAPELGDLIHAKSIVLRNNSFSGSIPKEVKALKDLEVLDLGYNNFSGPLPLDPSSNPSSTILLLDNNKLLCSTSPEVHELLKLSEIQVDEKHHSSHFHGESGKGRPISRNIVQAGNVPYRRLLKLEDLPKSSASVPTSSPEPSPLNFLPSSPSSSSPSRSSAASVSPPAFHTPSEHPVVSAKPPGPLSSPSASPFEWNHSALLIISGALGVAGIITILFVVFLLRSNNAVIVKPWVTGLSGQLQKAFVTGVPKLKRSELETACEEFSNIISSSAVDTVYKGTLSTGVEIAVTSTIVTSAKNWSKDLEEAFRKKIDTLSKVNHKNFVNLLGFCEEEEPFTRMMVFEYAPNGTLFEHLHSDVGMTSSRRMASHLCVRLLVKETEHLDWKARLRIAMGIAYSLEHMHQLTPPIFHKKLHTSTIYLTEDYASKISDFGFWNEIETPSINPESNIHDFGVILLEMITGKLSNSLDPKSLMADPTLKCFEEKEFERLCEVIKACVCSYPNQRPTMREVTTWMREITLITPEAARPRASPLWWAELEIASSTTEEVS